ncbi:MAG: fibronectin type III domain-containing protein [Clostridiales bacterium]|nr:fibronectin type III domain-containing protein [Clostridiales bacterium]
MFQYVSTGATNSEVTVESVESPAVTVVLDEDTEVTLPTTVAVTYNDSSTSDEAVTWDETDVETVNAAFASGTVGTYTVSGALEDGTAVTCTVTIQYVNLLDEDDAGFELSSADAAEKFTITGSGINLPATDDPYAGSYSMHWYLTSATTSSVTYNVAITLSPGEYTFECAAQGYAGDTVTLQILDTDGNVLFAGDAASMTGWAVWQTPTVSFTLTEETTVQLQIVVSMQAGGWGTADCLYLYKTGEVETHTHTYGDPTFTWAEDYSTCTATFTCAEGDDTQTVEATVTSKTTAATAAAEGKTVYTAAVTFNGETYTATQTVAIPVTAPEATKITSAVNRAKGIKLTWSAVDGAASYQVYRKTGSGSWKKVKTTSSTTWTDTAATKNGTKYQYKVYAVNAAGKSKASAIKTIYRLTAKHFTRAKNVKCRKISLKWTRNTKATGYQIQYSTSSDFSNAKTVKIKGNKNVTTTLKNLTKGKTYYIRMRPYKTSGGVTSYAGWSKVKTVKVKK